jgi:hypothetical protein
MEVAAGLFLIAHGLVHLGVWLAPVKDDAPFDPRQSWILGEAGAVSRILAIVAAALLITAGVLVLGDGGAALAVAGAAVSLLLIVITFNRWLLGAVAINIAIVILAAGEL